MDWLQYTIIVLASSKTQAQKPVVHPPLGVEASIRQGQGRRLRFLLNHTGEPKTVTVPQGRPELLSGTQNRRIPFVARTSLAKLRRLRQRKRRASPRSPASRRVRL